MEKTLITIRIAKFHKLLISVIGLILVFSTASIINAQQKVTSNCVETKVGDPKNSTPPSGCGNPSTNPSQPSQPNQPTEPVPSGQFGFPLVGGLSTVTAINSEMASYAGDFSNCMQGACHAEHAGLDVMTTPGNHGEVIAIADGTVNSVGGDASTCRGIDWGCRVEIIHNDGGITSAYVHIDPTVTVGMNVKRVDVLGNVHIWPASYGAGMDHLHFELRNSQGYNINPRNYYEEFNRFPPAPGYTPTVREHTARRGLPWVDDNKEFGETFLNHPPCASSDCWAR